MLDVTQGQSTPSLADALRPTPFPRIGRLAAKVLRAAYALTGHGCEQITVAHLDALLEMIQACVDARAARRHRINVHGDHAPRVPRGEQGADPRPGSHIENLRIGANQA